MSNKIHGITLKRRIVLFSGLLILFITSGCSTFDKNEEIIVNRVKSLVEDQFAPDKRTAVFDIKPQNTPEGWLLEGETDQEDAYHAFLDSLERYNISYNDRVVILPHPDLEGREIGVIRISVANLRSEKGHSKELVTQTLLGTPVRVLKKNGGWYFIQTPDKYLGWLENDALILMDEDEFSNYQMNPKLIYTALTGLSYSNPDKNAIPVSDLVAGNILEYVDKENGFFKVTYPDNRFGFIDTTAAEDLSEWKEKIRADSGSLTGIAMNLMGVPYLWGGTSAKGVDCSGYTKTIYFMNGMILPRDASQQDRIGILVDDRKNYDLLEPGDLLFFGKAATDSTSERVVHVGMWIGDMKFIHSSGDVHISSMDPDDPIYDEYNDQRYLRTNRILGTNYAEDLFIGRFY